MPNPQKGNITFGEVATIMGISALVGASLAKPKELDALQKYYTTWGPYTTKYINRANVLKQAGFRIPKSLVENNYHLKEAIQCYLHGLNESSLAAISRALSYELQKTFEKVENKKVPNNIKFSELIDWAIEKSIFKEHEQPIASDIRQLRNASEHRDLKISQIQVMNALESLKRLIEKVYSYNT